MAQSSLAHYMLGNGKLEISSFEIMEIICILIFAECIYAKSLNLIFCVSAMPMAYLVV